MAGRLVHDDVAVGCRDRLLAPVEVCELGHEIAHRSRGDKEAGLLAEQRRGTLLERVDGRVVAEDVVADLRLGHRAAHGRRGVGDGVRAQVDPGHGPARISRLARWRVWRPHAATAAGETPVTERRVGPASATICRPWTRGVAAQHACLSRRRSPVRIRSGPPSSAVDRPGFSGLRRPRARAPVAGARPDPTRALRTGPSRGSASPPAPRAG